MSIITYDNNIITVGGYNQGYYNGYDLGYTSGLSSSSPDYDPWIRNPEWLPIPEIGENEQVAYCLMRIDDTTGVGDNPNLINQMGMQVVGNGTITIDWGDGIIETLTSTITKYHDYDFNVCSGLTSYGFKQAMIKITSTSNIIATYFGITNTSTVGTLPKMLDIVERLPFTDRLTGKIGFSNTSLPPIYLERYWLINPVTGITLTNFCYNAPSLVEIIFTVTNPSAGLQALCYNCRALEHLDKVLITSDIAITTVSYVYNCVKFKKLPNWWVNLKKLGLSAAFSGVYSLRKIDLGDVSTVQSLDSLAVNAASCTDINYTGVLKPTSILVAFSGMISLKRFNGVSKATIDISSIALTTSFTTSFANVYHLEEIEYKNPSGIYRGSMSSTYTGCQLLRKITGQEFFRPSGVCSATYDQCRSLQEIYIDLLNATNVTGVIGGNYELRSLRLLNINPLAIGANSITVAQSKLDRDALVVLFNDLPSRSATTTGTLTITGALGQPALSAADKLIITSKNYTLVE
jgi:hypothetical protein